MQESIQGAASGGTHGGLRATISDRWRKLGLPLRYGGEAFAVRLAVALVLAFLTRRILDAEGYMATLRGHFAAVELPIVDASFKITTYSLPIDEAVFLAVLALVAGAAFSPWRAPSLVLTLASAATLFVSFPYIRLSTNFLRQIPILSGALPEGLQLQGKDPPLGTVLLVACGFVVIVLFAVAEGSRALRRAYEERGVASAEVRNLGLLQAAAAASVAGGALLAALGVSFVLALVRSPLREVPLPRVNPVLGFLFMGVCLAVAIVAFAWKPKPAEDARTPLEGLKLSMRREKAEE